MTPGAEGLAGRAERRLDARFGRRPLPGTPVAPVGTLRPVRRVTRVGLLLVQSAVLLLVLAAVGHAPALVAISMTFLGLVGAARVWPSHVGKLRVDVVDPPEQLVVGRAATLTLRVTSSRPEGGGECWGVLAAPLADATAAELPSVPAGGISVGVPVTGRQHGWLDGAVWQVTELGLWGLVRTTAVIPVHAPARLPIVPATVPVRPLPTPPPPRGFEDEESAGRAVLSGTSPRGVREFRTGDEPRSVHWRATARTGRLLVREWDPPAAKAGLCVVPVLAPMTQAAEGELLLSALASLGLAAAAEGRPLSVEHLGGGGATAERSQFLQAFADVPIALPGRLTDLVKPAGTNAGPGGGVVLGVTSGFTAEAYSACVAALGGGRLDIVTAGVATGTTRAPGCTVLSARQVLGA